MSKVINVNYQKLHKTAIGTKRTAADHYRRDELIELGERINGIINDKKLEIPEIMLYSKDNKTYMVNEIHRCLDKINEKNVEMLERKLGVRECFQKDTKEPKTPKGKLIRFFGDSVSNYHLGVGKYVELTHKIKNLVGFHSLDKFEQLRTRYSNLMMKIRDIIYNSSFDESERLIEEEFIKDIFEKMERNIKHTLYNVLNDNNIQLKDI